MNLRPRIPRIHWPWVEVHIPTLAACYLTWVLVGASCVALVHRYGITMLFEHITDANTVWAAVLGVTMFLALIVTYSAFIENQKSEKDKAKEAKLNGTTYDSVNGAISQKFFWGYAIIAIVGAAVVATVVMFAINCLAETEWQEWVATTDRAMLVGCIISCLAYIFMDKYLLRNAADGSFFKAIEEPAIDAFLNGSAADSAAAGAENIQALKKRIATLREKGYNSDEITAIIGEMGGSKI